MDFIDQWVLLIHNLIQAIQPALLRAFIEISILIVVSGGAYFLARLIYSITKKRLKTISTLLPAVEIVLSSPLIPRILKLIPLFVACTLIPLLFGQSNFEHLLLTLGKLWFCVICARSFAALMTVFYQIGNQYRGVSASPQKGIFQILTVLAYCFAVVGMIAIISGRNPTYILSGLTALSAVFMLVFKDAILGLTAGVTLASNGFVKIGDWIVVPGAGADGDVIDIALTTVRVQNFDKTITTIPAYDLVSKPFTNWRGMVDAGGRRIKRAIQIDLDSIAFATEADLKRWKKIDFLKDYLAQKEVEITAANAARPTSKDSLANARTLTNIGTFRAYCIAYLRNHARIHQELTLLVRQLPPAERGLPLEIYCFTNSTVWAEYEATQSDIFDHLLAILPEFGLSAFQVTSAAALRTAVKATIH